MILIINLFIFTALCLLGRKYGDSRALRILFVLLFLAGSINAAHYAHLFDNFAGYYEYRSWQWTDFVPSLTGLYFGAFIRSENKNRKTSRICLCVLASVAVILPELKSTVMPADYAGMRDHEEADGVVHQTTPSSCGPASLATLLRRQGISATEREIAEACRTSQSGTEVWHLARFARSRGVECHFVISKKPPTTPAIIGTKITGTGHFVALFENNNGKLLIADPIRGRFVTSAEKMAFTGFAMTVSPKESD